MSSARSIAAIASLPHSSGEGFTRTGLSLTLDTCFANHLAPARVVFANEVREFLRRIGIDDDALRAELGLELRAVHDLGHLGVDTLHDRRRRLRGNEEPEPRIER